MQQEQRAFFRFDVSLPVYFEPVTGDDSCLQVRKEQLIEAHLAQKMAKESTQLQHLFEDAKHIANGGVQLFTEFDQKLQFMAWLVESIADGHNPKEHAEFKQRMQVQAQYKPPKSKGASKVISLLQALYLRIDNTISELLDMLDNKINGKLFMFQKPVTELFSSQTYIPNLATLAQQKNWLASVIEQLIFKFNFYESLLNNLKRVYHKRSDFAAWPIESVNLAAGGFSLLVETNYVKGDHVCVLFLMDDQFVFGKAVCVFSQGIKSAKGLQRTAFKFTDISNEDEAHIVRFLMGKELEQRELLKSEVTGDS